jgi:hypothetical protein
MASGVDRNSFNFHLEAQLHQNGIKPAIELETHVLKNTHMAEAEMLMKTNGGGVIAVANDRDHLARAWQQLDEGQRLALAELSVFRGEFEASSIATMAVNAQAPTGTETGAPVSCTSSPRINPSVLPNATLNRPAAKQMDSAMDRFVFAIVAIPLTR